MTEIKIFLFRIRLMMEWIVMRRTVMKCSSWIQSVTSIVWVVAMATVQDVVETIIFRKFKLLLSSFSSLLSMLFSLLSSSSLLLSLLLLCKESSHYETLKTVSILIWYCQANYVLTNHKIRIICYWWRSGFVTHCKSGLFRWNTIPFHRNFWCSWFFF